MQLMQRLAGESARYVAGALAAVFLLVTVGAETAHASPESTFVILQAGAETPRGKFIVAVRAVQTGNAAFGYVSGELSAGARGANVRVDTALPGHPHLASHMTGFGDAPWGFLQRLPRVGEGRL